MIQQYTPDEAVQESQHDIFIKLSDVLAMIDKISPPQCNNEQAFAAHPEYIAEDEGES